MPVNIPGSSAAYPANVVAPVDADARNAASIQAGLTNLADRTAWLKATAAPAILNFGNGDLTTDPGNKQMNPGWSDSALATGDRFITVTRAGVLSRLYVRALTAHSGAGSTCTFAIVVNGSVKSDTVVSLAAGATSAGRDTFAAPVTVAAGDRVAVVVNKTGTITISALNVSASFELTNS